MVTTCSLFGTLDLKVKEFLLKGLDVPGLDSELEVHEEVLAIGLKLPPIIACALGDNL